MKTYLLRTSDADEWLGVLSHSWRHDFYHLPGYHVLAEQRGEGAARMFVYEDDGYMIALPFLLRSLDGVAGLNGGSEGWMDASSVYGYAGPVSSHSQLPERVQRDFRNALYTMMERLGVVTIFSRLHPLIPQSELLCSLGECCTLGKTVSIDLSLSAERQRSLLRENHRRGIGKLQRLGVVCVEDREFTYLDRFVAIYHETMRRVNAGEFYLFDRGYFERLSRLEGAGGHLVIALLNGEPIAGAFLITCDGIVQYHLGGTSDQYLKFAPMKLLVSYIQQWASERRFQVVHLGGGVGSKEDSLFHFKAGFSDRRHAFLCWRWVLLPEVYAILCSSVRRFRERHGLQCANPTFFPEYRSTAIPANSRTIELNCTRPNAPLHSHISGGETPTIARTPLPDGNMDEVDYYDSSQAPRV